MKHTLSTLLTGLFIWLFANVVIAGEGALYDPVAPKGSAFVRLVNLSGAELKDVNVSGKVFPELEAFAVGDYLYFTTYELEAMINGHASSLIVAQDKRYSVVVSAAGSVKLIEDPVASKRTKAMIVAYNLANHGKVDLKTADGKAAVLAGIPFQERAFREINAVKVDFGFFENTQRLSQTGKKIALQRGSAYSAFLVGNDKNYRLIWVENKDNTRI